MKKARFSKKILTIDEIREKVAPIAQKYGLKKVYLFGSYARGEATGKSDVDLCAEDGSQYLSILDIGGLYEEFQDALHKKIDIVMRSDIKEKNNFKNAIETELEEVYEQA